MPAQNEQPSAAARGPRAAVLLSWFLASLAAGLAAAQTDDGPARRPPQMESTPRQLLELYGVEESQLAMLADGQPLGPDDEETLIRILYRMPQFPLDVLERAARQASDWTAWPAEPLEHRADALAVTGRATSVRRVALQPEVAERFEFDSYFVVTIESADAPFVFTLCTRAVPAAWQDGRPIDQRAVAVGIFLKMGAVSEGRQEMVLATPRVAWLPEQPDPARGVLPDHVLLADLGFDVGLLDDVRPRHRKPLRSEDRECFYQMLAAVGRADRERLAAAARRNVPFGPLLQAPAEQQGRVLMIQGTARRITKVLIGERDLRARLGIDHYFQIDIFVPLGDQVVRLGAPAEGRPAPTFTNNYPVTVCVRRLPPDLPAGDDLREEVRIAAAYFKLWAYRSEYISSFDDRQLQVSPMLIGLEPERVAGDPPASPYVTVGAGILFLGILAAAWYGLWRSSRADARFEKSTLKRQFELRDGQSLDDAGLDGRDGPDFSKLDAGDS